MIFGGGTTGCELTHYILSEHRVGQPAAPALLEIEMTTTLLAGICAIVAVIFAIVVPK